MEGMASALDDQRDYLVALTASCAAQPAIHAHQLIALERERSLRAGAGDADRMTPPPN